MAPEKKEEDPRCYNDDSDPGFIHGFDEEFGATFPRRIRFVFLSPGSKQIMMITRVVVTVETWKQNEHGWC